ncbi:MAG: ankyrin repeat domain-containing protein [Alphaproteobacteria bacterium]|nr:MAG: ankyrin repeat domain-containing protein [Alphaproteobacteria bacterium]
MTHPLNPQMTKAAQDGNLAELQRLAAAGAEVSFSGTDDPLIQASCKGHIDCMRWLLDRGAVVDRQDNDGRWTPLLCTAYYGHAEAARLLLERGASRQPRNHRDQTALQCARAQNHAAVARLIENNADEISFCHPLSDRVMQEVYNFPLRERVTLIRKEEGGPVEAMQRESFSSLDDLTGLRKAFAEHKRMGGKLEESDVFPGILNKARIIRKEM